MSAGPPRRQRRAVLGVALALVVAGCSGDGGRGDAGAADDAWAQAFAAASADAICESMDVAGLAALGLEAVAPMTTDAAGSPPSLACRWSGPTGPAAALMATSYRDRAERDAVENAAWAEIERVGTDAPALADLDDAAQVLELASGGDERRVVLARATTSAASESAARAAELGDLIVRCRVASDARVVQVTLHGADPALGIEDACAAGHASLAHLAGRPGSVASAARAARSSGGLLGDHRCAGWEPYGWSFSAAVSGDDGLVLGESSHGGRQLTRRITVPYLRVRIGGPSGGWRRVELTPSDRPLDAEVLGAFLAGFECHPDGEDMWVGATYVVDLGRVYGSSMGTLRVEQQYRFRAPVGGDRCEPTGKFGCVRFWPTISYRYDGAASCIQPAGAAACPLLERVETVQRMEYRPEGNGDGAVDAFRDRGGLEGAAYRSGVESKGKGDSMRHEDEDEAIVDGRRGDWDSIHISATDRATGPGINFFDELTPGCPSCVHMHWAWGKVVNCENILAVFCKQKFTDGLPQIPAGSRQDATFGIVRAIDSELDPVERGWRDLIDDSSPRRDLRQHPTVVFWEMSSSAPADAAFPLLEDRSHGGDGSIFFGTGHDHGGPPSDAPALSPAMTAALDGVAGPLGSGCDVSGAGGLPDGVYFGFVPSPPARAATQVDFDLACYFSSAGLEATGVPPEEILQEDNVVNDSPRLRSLPLAADLSYWKLDQAQLGGPPTCGSGALSSVAGVRCLVAEPFDPDGYGELWQGSVVLRVEDGQVVEVAEFFLS